jgi:hypothetical protein
VRRFVIEFLQVIVALKVADASFDLTVFEIGLYECNLNVVLIVRVEFQLSRLSVARKYILDYSST